MKNNINTLVIHGGISEDKNTGALSIPIYQATTFRQLELGKNKGYEYGRSGNPTREALEALIRDLEEGYSGFAFASGLAAITTTLLLFKSRDKILISKNVYGGTFRILDQVFSNFDIKYEIVDTTDINKVDKIFKKDKNIKAIILESPANPLLTITDIKAISCIAKKYDALTIVDNTFMTPYLQKPLTLGADIVIHSGTKYLGGHTDVICGLAVVKDKNLSEKLKFLHNAVGSILEPFDSWLLMRGIKTLAVRLDRHLENADYVAKFLENVKGIKKVFYPGLKSFEGYEINKKQAKGAGGMISFLLSQDYDIKIFYKSVKLIALAESLGGVESLISHPATMTHASIPYNIRQKIGITDNLVRLSVGIEDKKDIVNDLEKALKKAYKK
ncbi:MAG: PLP-dependent aspartate aminotransferase family protein [Elusimicrobiota bacterium]|jgi:cystathionine beta-lyase|nr:PLP-dependent aspartate aminotransferase family protein [Elusimicrobiota bacterium]